MGKLLSGKDVSELPTGGYIWGGVHHLAESATANDRILFVFSGHGTKDGGEFYLVPEDGRAQHTQTLICFRGVLEVHRSGASAVILTATHTCHSDGLPTHQEKTRQQR